MTTEQKQQLEAIIYAIAQASGQEDGAELFNRVEGVILEYLEEVK